MRRITKKIVGGIGVGAGVIAFMVPLFSGLGFLVFLIGLAVAVVCLGICAFIEYTES